MVLAVGEAVEVVLATMVVEKEVIGTTILENRQ